MTRAMLISAALVACTTLGLLTAHAEDDAAAQPVTLRVAPKLGETLRFKRTLTLRCRSTVGEATIPSVDYDVIQMLSVKATSSGSGKHAFAVECTRVEATGTMHDEGGTETGSWSSESPELDVEDGESILCAANAMGIGRVLAGTTNGLTVDDRANGISMALSRETRALERETGPSSSFGPSLLEGVAWRPFFLTGRLPEQPVSAGTTYARDVSWAAKVPKRAVHGPAEMHVKAADAERVVIECDSVPRLHKIIRAGAIGAAMPESAFTGARVVGSLTLDAQDGLPIDVTWKIAGTYVHHVPFWGDDDMHEQVELTVRVERLD